MSLITIVNVEITSRAGAAGKKGYEQAEVVYKQEYNGKQDVKTKKIMSFANPAVFAVLKSAKTGEVYEVTQEKNGEFWNWTSLARSTGEIASSGSAASQPATAAPRAAVNGGFNRDFETKEERTARQQLIVRQSSLSNAINLLMCGAKHPPAVDEVVALANKFVAYVYDAPELDLFNSPNDLDASASDIPY